MTLRPTVQAVQPARRLEWLGHLGIPGIFDGRHSFLLEPLPDGRTRFVQQEAFSGFMVPFTGKLLARTEAGFRAMNEALSMRAETQVAA
jgi:hypothetical protein